MLMCGQAQAAWLGIDFTGALENEEMIYTCTGNLSLGDPLVQVEMQKPPGISALCYALHNEEEVD